MNNTYRGFLACVGLLAALTSAPASAQPVASYPSKPIKLIVPFPPGGSTDILARTLGLKLHDAWGQPVIIDNRGGAGGAIGADLAAKSPADGYTLMMGHIGTLAVNVSLYSTLPYDPVKDFAPVSMVAVVPNVLVVNPSLAAKNVPELIAYARANPGKLEYSSGGNGSAAHLALEYFKLQSRTSIMHVPYKGTSPSVVNVIGGQVSMTMTGAPAVIPHVKSGRLRALAVSSTKRLDALPDIPTIAEAGIPGFEATQWYGIVAPAGTPPAVVQKLNTEINRIMQSKEMRDRLNVDGAIAAPGTPEQFGAYIKAEIARWATVIKAAGMKVD